ncbi:MAG: DUF4905 domain-containing protein [Ignavibacteria bacterium]|jgi:hypothetical protein|nr:DUF4905 domain-containing protein [Ignavibacteria bacterium]MCU7502741.1 DUF4905 domain-containing protein [Ignavibacteria bacterium]MCU7517330.1 DUF4905 domain-containing protein [Ignavibacteria bacterium]
MKLKKKYSFTNNRQLWRLLLSESNKLIIEDRDVQQKQAFFSCLQAETGKEIFRNFQPGEKFWVGIEAIYKDIIYFHKFAKPDMPGHKEIIAFDILQKKVLWQVDYLSFLFVHDGLVYAFRQKFEGWEFFGLDYKTGEIIEEIGNDAPRVNSIRDSIDEMEKFRGYLFPETFHEDKIEDIEIKQIIKQITEGRDVAGNIEFIEYEGLLLFNFHARVFEKSLVNRFLCVDTGTGKILFEDVLNASANAFVPDSFFMKDNLVFLLKEKTELIVCSVE